MANEAIGTITCPFCESDSDVKQNKRGKLYFTCKPCGIANLHGQRFQQYIKDNATMYGTPEGQRIGGGKDPQQAKPEVEPVATEAKPEKKGWLESLLSDDEEQEA
jgi:hypothetical protein